MQAEPLRMNDRLEKISRLNESQLEKLDKWLEYQLETDCDGVSYERLKRTVYSIYACDIANLISKIEVYFHDLPMFLYGMITNIVKMHTMAVSIKDETVKCQDYEDILGYEKFIVNLLNVVLYDLYEEQINHYVKVFKRYNCKGIRIKRDIEKNKVRIKGKNNEIIDIIDKPFHEVISTLTKNIKADYKVCEAAFRKRYEITRFQVYSFKNSNRKFISHKNIDVKNESSEIDEDLIRCCNNMEGIVGLCNDYYSEIMGNGYKASIWNKIEKVLFWTSVILSVIGTIKIIL